MYTEESIDQIRQVDIVDIISKYVKLDKRNKGCCPFHNEKTPSFSVSQSKQAFKCFGCGAGGDVIAFVIKHRNCDFIEAVQIIADMKMIALDHLKNFDQEAYTKKRIEVKGLRQVLLNAHGKYKAQLFLPENKNAMDYWNGRGYSLDTISYWGLGYAPMHFGFLTRQYTSDGYLPSAIKLGLISLKDDKSHRDAFINRVIFPIQDENGELISFAGRVIEKDSKYPKYKNGAVSPLYNKSRTLFGLYQAIPSIKSMGFAILTEGYTDVITMHTAGAKNAIATCGTAFTDDMARLLKRYTTHVVLMRDADTAGENAEDKDLELLLKFGFKVDIYALEEGEDPDSFAKNFINEYSEEDLVEESEEMEVIAETQTES